MTSLCDHDEDDLGLDNLDDFFGADRCAINLPPNHQKTKTTSMDSLAVIGGSSLKISLTNGLLSPQHCQWNLISPASPTTQEEEKEEEEEDNNSEEQENGEQQELEDPLQEVQEPGTDDFSKQETNAVVCQELMAKYNDKDTDLAEDDPLAHHTGTQLVDSELLECEVVTRTSRPLQPQISLDASTESIPFYDDSSSSEDEDEYEQQRPKVPRNASIKAKSSSSWGFAKAQVASARVQQVYRQFRARTSSNAAAAPSPSPTGTRLPTRGEVVEDSDNGEEEEEEELDDEREEDTTQQQQGDKDVKAIDNRVRFWSNRRDSFRESVSSRLSLLRHSAESLGHGSSLLPTAKAKARAQFVARKAESFSSAVKTLRRPRFGGGCGAAAAAASCPQRKSTIQ